MCQASVRLEFNRQTMAHQVHHAGAVDPACAETLRMAFTPTSIQALRDFLPPLP